MLESMVNQFRGDVELVQCSYDVLYDNGNCHVAPNLRQGEILGNNEVLSAYLLGEIKQSCWCKLYRKDVIAEIRFDTAYSVGEDSKFVYEFCKKCKSAVLIPDAMYHYFQRESSVMRKGLNEHTFEALNLVDLILEDTSNTLHYKEAVRKEAVLCMDLITAINIEHRFLDRLPDLRRRMVSKWHYIIFSKIYSIKFKAGVILLAIMPSTFYRLFTAARLKGN